MTDVEIARKVENYVKRRIRFDTKDYSFTYESDMNRVVIYSKRTYAYTPFRLDFNDYSDGRKRSLQNMIDFITESESRQSLFDYNRKDVEISMKLAGMAQEFNKPKTTRGEIGIDLTEYPKTNIDYTIYEVISEVKEIQI